MSDAGSDVKRLLSTGLGLRWEPCLAHLTNTATKHPLGLELRATSRNQEMTELIESIRTTVRTVKDVETMDTLFQSLRQLDGKDKSVRLLTFQAHRFLGLFRVLKRLLVLWTSLEAWFSKRSNQSSKAATRSFPLAGKKDRPTERPAVGVVCRALCRLLGFAELSVPPLLSDVERRRFLAGIHAEALPVATALRLQTDMWMVHFRAYSGVEVGGGIELLPGADSKRDEHRQRVQLVIQSPKRFDSDCELGCASSLTTIGSNGICVDLQV
ncbi:hypothetical protein PybrP1_011634 [[Pythium] brassicae (nom. inval.)]|nr:hypothetical protein PybrP1_011634 [[Pythium] brassicae (nom. inval.)]